MAKRSNGTLTAEEVQTKRISDLAARKKRALADLEEARQMEAELGVSVDEPLEPTPTSQAPLNSDPLQGLDAILSEIQSEDNSRWEAYNLNGGPAVRLGVFPLAQWPDHLDELARQIGGGVVLVKFRRGNGAYATQRTFTFDKAMYKRQDIQAAPVAAAGGGHEALVEMLRTMREELREERKNSQALQIKMLELSSRSPFADLKGMKDMIETIAPKPKSPMDSVKEVFELLAILKDDGIEAPSPLEKMINKGVDMLAPLIKAGAEKLLRPIPPRGTERPVERTQPAALPEPDAKGPPMSGPVGPQEASAPVLEMTEEKAAEHYGKQLVTVIEMGFSPETAVSQIMDVVKEDEAKLFLKVVTMPDVIGKLQAGAPKLKDYVAWVTRFVALAKEDLTAFLVPDAGEVAEEANA